MINIDSESVPEWHKEPCMLGIVLGPMVYAAAFCPAADADRLKAKGFADSKTLTEEKRERLYRIISAEPRLTGLADCLSAAFISGRMLAAEKTSLNALAMASTCSLIQKALEAGVNLVEVFVDTVGDAGRHRDALSQRFPGIHFTVCPKADAIYPIVSAASIVAKVTRDRAIVAEAAKLGRPAADSAATGSAAAAGGNGKAVAAAVSGEEAGDTAAKAGEAAGGEAGGLPAELGSGYPADPLTKAWLEREVDTVFGWPALVRFSWATCNPILEARGVPVQWECEADAPGQTKLSFGGSSSAGGGGGSSGAGAAGRHSYWRARKLQRVAGGAF